MFIAIKGQIYNLAVSFFSWIFGTQGSLIFFWEWGGGGVCWKHVNKLTSIIST